MNLLDAFIIGIVEGITEFLPISSTGHMIVAAEFLSIAQTDAVKSFEVIIQVGAIAAILVLYGQTVCRNKDLLGKVLVSSIPVGIVGLLFAEQIKSLFSVSVVAWAFIIGGIVFLLVETFHKKKFQEPFSETADITYKNVAWVALAQVLSLIPGTSRSGATIIGGMLGGLDRKTATEFSFLTAVPVMIAVTAYDLQTYTNALTENGVAILIVGLVTSFVVAYFSVKFLLHFVKNYTFKVFGWYRIVVGALLLIFFV